VWWCVLLFVEHFGFHILWMCVCVRKRKRDSESQLGASKLHKTKVPKHGFLSQKWFFVFVLQNGYWQVSVPCNSLFNMVTVRCGHCANLLSVNMGATVQAAPPQDPQVYMLSKSFGIVFLGNCFFIVESLNGSWKLWSHPLLKRECASWVRASLGDCYGWLYFILSAKILECF